MNLAVPARVGCLLALLLAQGALLTIGPGAKEAPPMATISPEAAEAGLRQRLAASPLLRDATVARVPDLDTAGLLAFSVMPRLTGRAGEVLYLVGPDEILSSGRPADFEELMRRLGVGVRPGVLDVHDFARLFLRLRALRSGVVLDRPDGHVLLQPGQLPPGRFSPPRADFDAAGARYRFWCFDTDRLAPSFWDVRVAPDGAVSFTESATGEPA